MWRGGATVRAAALIVAAGALIASCVEAETTATEPPLSPAGPCGPFDGQPLQSDTWVQLERLGVVDGVTVHGAVYPHPDYEGSPWSQWGQGIVLPDGRFFSAIGDHLGPDGNSYVYEYHPETRRLTLVSDILSRVDHVDGTWGYGKVHAQMTAGPCGEIYFSTYWGSVRDLEFEGNYRGDIIFRLDPAGRTIQPLTTPVEFHGQPSMAGSPREGLLFGEAADPFATSDGEDAGPFFVFDVETETVVHLGPSQPHVGFRSILVDDEGRAYYSIGDGLLEVYDPASDVSQTHGEPIPGDWLRAATSPTPEGVVYGVTTDPDRFFKLRPDGSIEELGDALDYTTSIAASPDGTRFYYMPGAHGDSGEWGSPLIEVDGQSGSQTVVAELADLVEDTLGLTIGGTYNLAIGEEPDLVYMGVNAGEAGSDERFGEVVLLVLELP